MSRSLWKNNYCDLSLLFLKKKFSKNFYFQNRNCNILPRHIGSILNIYNGKKYSSRLIYENYINHKLGEFSITTEMGSKIHSRNNKNKRKKLKNKFKKI